MGRIPHELRAIIAQNIRECRQKMFPGRGGGKQCVETFSKHIGKHVSHQQWSPWERGSRTPDEVRLQQIAYFFGVTVEFLRTEHRKPISKASGFADNRPSLSFHKNTHGAELPSLMPEQAGSPASFFWLANKLVDSLVNDGIRIHLERSSAELLVSLLQKNMRL